MAKKEIDKKLPKPAKVKTVTTKVSWQDFLKNGKFSEQEKKDAEVLVKIYEKVTKSKCVMWGSIFGFATWHYVSPKTGRNGLWPASAFALRKGNITVYVMSGAKNYSKILEKLGKYKISGGSCVYIKKLEDIDLKILEKLIKLGLEDLKKKYKVEK